MIWPFHKIIVVVPEVLLMAGVDVVIQTAWTMWILEISIPFDVEISVPVDVVEVAAYKFL